MCIRDRYRPTCWRALCICLPNLVRIPLTVPETGLIFGWPFVKRFALCYRTIALFVFPVCLSVCNVGVLWPNAWMDQNETWHRGRPRPRRHCVRWAPSSPQRDTAPQLSAHVYCGQTFAHLSYCWALLSPYYSTNMKMSSRFAVDITKQSLNTHSCG